MNRTNNCGELSKANLNENVKLSGWVNKIREKGFIIWIDLRDRYGITQLVFDKQRSSEKLFSAASELGREFVIEIEGNVIERKSINEKIKTGQIEVLVSSLSVLNKSLTPPFTIENESDGGEELRMKYRYLDIRREPVKENLIFRHRLSLEVRNYLSDNSFIDIETPYLIKSTPEGARDFIVPSRLNPDHYYALPQSPQIFKQLKTTIRKKRKDEKKRKTSENSNDESPRGGRRKPYAEEKKEVSARRYVQRRVESSGAYGDISNERLPRKISPSSSSSSSTRQKSSSQPPPNKKIADTRDEIKEKRRKTGRLNNKKETRKSIIDKNEKLKLKPNVKALLNFINGNVHKFSVVNCATAAHKCGTFVRDSKYLRKSSDKKPISLTEVNPNSRSLVEKGGDEGEDEFATNETLIRTCQNILANKHFQKLIQD